MRLAASCGLAAAAVEVVTLADRRCLVVTRFDRDPSGWPPKRIHQEDLCQALGLTPDFKYQHEGWRVPSYRGLAELLEAHSVAPGADRLAGALAAVFHFLVGNADAHAKNVALLHDPAGVRLAPLYDVVCTAVYPQLNAELALGVGEEFDPLRVTSMHWADLAEDFALNAHAFEAARLALADKVLIEARALASRAREESWYEPCVDDVVEVIERRCALLASD